MAQLPEINVYFTEKANSFSERSERGNVILIIRDSGAAKVNGSVYTSLSDFEADSSKYTQTNQTAIRDVLGFGVYALYIVAIGASDSIDKALLQIPGMVKTGWITVAGITNDDSTGIATWIKAQEDAGKSYKAVVYKSSADSQHVVNFATDAVIFADGRTAAASTYTPSIAAILASCNVKRGATNYPCSNLKSVTEPASVESAVDEGKLVLINDEDNVVRIASAVNSLTTLDTHHTADMTEIEVVEAMDMMVDDIKSNFRKNFMGRFKNTRGNQMVYVSEMISYFSLLSTNDIISDEFTCEINVDAQREAWEASGRDTKDWNDDQVKEHPYKRSMFVKASVLILESIETLDFAVTLN